MREILATDSSSCCYEWFRSIALEAHRLGIFSHIASLDHWHHEDEAAALIETRWVSGDLATASLYDLFHDGQSQANPIIIYFCRPVQFAKTWKELWDVTGFDSCPCVPDMYYQFFKRLFVADQDIDRTLARELEGIFHQVYEHLLESALVSYENRQSCVLFNLV